MTEHTMERKFLLWKSFNQTGQEEGRDKGFSKNLPKGTENDIEIKFVKSNVPEQTQKTIQVIMRHLIKELVIFLVEEEQNLT